MVSWEGSPRPNTLNSAVVSGLCVWSLCLRCVWSLRAAPAPWAVTGLTGCWYRRGLQRTRRYERCGSSECQRTSREWGNANTSGRRRRKWLRCPQHDDAPVPDPQLANPCSHGGGVREWEIPACPGTRCGLCHFCVSAMGCRDALLGHVPAGWEGWAAIALRELRDKRNRGKCGLTGLIQLNLLFRPFDIKSQITYGVSLI